MVCLKIWAFFCNKNALRRPTQPFVEWRVGILEYLLTESKNKPTLTQNIAPTTLYKIKLDVIKSRHSVFRTLLHTHTHTQKFSLIVRFISFIWWITHTEYVESSSQRETEKERSESGFAIAMQFYEREKERREFFD